MTYRTKSKALIRSGTNSWRTVGTLPAGTLVRSSHQAKGWAYIDKHKGWITLLNLEPVDPTDKKS